MTNEEYQKAPGISASGLKMFADDPASLEWIRKCPVDKEGFKILDFGSAFHCSMLEPDKFLERYAIAPNAPKNTKAGKKEHADFQEEHGHKTILTFKEGKQLDLMRGSCLAHPYIKALFDNQTGTEVSLVAKDTECSLDIKCRNDMESEINGKIIVSDLKTIDKLDNIEKNIYLFKYHLQAAHYREVYYSVNGKYPDLFVFIFVSKSLSAGRYPVRVVELDDETMAAGKELRSELMTRYLYCQANNNFPGVHKAGLPRWAT